MLEKVQRKEKSVISAANAATMTAMMEDVIRRGTGTRANIGRPAAGKTGTTSDYHDAWFVGYTPDLVAGVWIGNDSNGDLHGMAGGMTPAVIWQSFMLKAHAGLPIRHFDGVVSFDDTSDDLPIEGSAKEKVDKKKTDEKGKDAGKTGASAQGKGGAGATPAPAVQSTPFTDEVPEPGMGVEKGRN